MYRGNNSFLKSLDYWFWEFLTGPVKCTWKNSYLVIFLAPAQELWSNCALKKQKKNWTCQARIDQNLYPQISLIVWFDPTLLLWHFFSFFWFQLKIYKRNHSSPLIIIITKREVSAWKMYTHMSHSRCQVSK